MAEDLIAMLKHGSEPEDSFSQDRNRWWVFILRRCDTCDALAVYTRATNQKDAGNMVEAFEKLDRAEESLVAWVNNEASEAEVRSIAVALQRYCIAA